MGQNPDIAQNPVEESSILIRPSSTDLDGPPPYSALYPENETMPNTTFDSNISRSFQTNTWQDITINGHQIFKELSHSDHKMLEEAVDTPDSSVYAVKIALDVAQDQKCSSFYEFLKIFAFVKNYLKFKSDKQMKSVLPEGEIRETARYEPGVMSQVDGAPPQPRHPGYFIDPFCCWLPSPPIHGDTCPCCLCCFDCCGDSGTEVSPGTATGSPDCCGGCPDCDCDCGDCSCDCGAVDCGSCDCGACDCGGF